MPRGARLDAPGTLHHVIVRGIERGAIFQDDEDRSEYVRRLHQLVKVSGTAVYAYSLMSNHVHLLLKSGTPGLSTFMRRLLSGYAQYYNRRHHRVGYVFQNRYRSIICEEEAYFTKLVAYIHLNPLKAGLVSSIEELEKYAWSGHAIMMGRIGCDWFDRDYVLQFFGNREGAARNAYLSYLKEEMGVDREYELTGGGLVRSHGGWSNVLSMRKQGLHEEGDERILGGGDFVHEVLEEASEAVKRQVASGDRVEQIQQEILTACQNSGITVDMLRSGSRRVPIPTLRKTLVKKLVIEYGLSLAETARQIGVTTGAVSQLLRR